MFSESQIESYKNIVPSKDLKQKVLLACSENFSGNEMKTKDKVLISKKIYPFASIAACLVLFISVFLFYQGKGEPLLLKVGDQIVDSEEIVLSDSAETIFANPEEIAVPNLMETASVEPRSYSMEPRQYSILLSADNEVEIVSVEGNIETKDDGTLKWTILIPEEDMVFKLVLRAQEETYYIPLKYHVKDGSFSISCSKKEIIE